jgi:flagellar motor switch protein FliM
VTAARSKAGAVTASLVRDDDPAPRFPGLDRIGHRISNGLKDALVCFGVADALVAQAGVDIMPFGQWRHDHAGLQALCRFQLKPLKGSALLAVPARSVCQMVDSFYGGAGDVSEEKAEFSASELRYVARIGDACLPLLRAAWTETLEIRPILAEVSTDAARIMLAKEKDQVVVQTFHVKASSMKPFALEFIYPVASLKSVPSLIALPQEEEEATIDPVWAERLNDAVMQVRLPMRSIFARPEMPLSRLLTLQAGDVIPVCLPNHIPVTVAGRLFAQGSVGESSGRAAIRIEKLEQGFMDHE